ncbi:hypothetical protein [Pseudonocardia sp. NPDC049154]
MAQIKPSSPVRLQDACAIAPRARTSAAYRAMAEDATFSSR